MRVAALYDVHGNLPALEAVLPAVEAAGADAVVFGGDLVSGPFPAETLALARSLGDVALFVRGNADREAAAGPGWVTEQLAEEARRFLAGLPEKLTLEVDELGPALFCHATPRSDEELVTTATPLDVFAAAFSGLSEELVVCGHTHVPYDRKAGDVRVVNGGSVGMPYGGRGAHWLLLGPDVSFAVTEYDYDAAAERVRTSGYPEAEDFAASNVLDPPSAEEATAYFERLAGR